MHSSVFCVVPRGLCSVVCKACVLCVLRSVRCRLFTLILCSVLPCVCPAFCVVSVCAAFCVSSTAWRLVCYAFLCNARPVYSVLCVFGAVVVSCVFGVLS